MPNITLMTLTILQCTMQWQSTHSQRGQPPPLPRCLVSLGRSLAPLSTQPRPSSVLPCGLACSRPFTHTVTVLFLLLHAPRPRAQCSQGHSTLWQIPSFHTLWLKPSPLYTNTFRRTPQSLMDTRAVLSVNREHGCAGVCRVPGFS